MIQISVFYIILADPEGSATKKSSPLILGSDTDRQGGKDSKSGREIIFKSCFF